MTNLNVLLLFTVTMLVSGCGLLVLGKTQEVGFQSAPTAATVTIDGVERAKTPVVLRLSRKRSHIVRMELPGFKPVEATLTRSVSGWVWGNLVFGGVVGLAVDAMTGAMYKLTPDQISGQFQIAQASVGTRDGVYVCVVMQPDSGWAQIGQLER